MLSRRTAFAALLAASTVAFSADVQNMGGSWKLNQEKSRWGKRDKPTGVELKIEHNEPAIRYTGTVINANATDRRDFKFDGAIDGQPHPATGPEGEGAMTINRVNKFTTKWTFRSNDGKVTEEAMTSISGNGREMTRRMERKAPEGTVTWTEFYEKTS
ncbi:MAG: hypothetical protein H7210_03390 [Pyrinomonadaceae bacterium]|nr:hypothetical protein [Phycisphaerales bacterium]